MNLQGCATGEVVIPQGQRCGGEHICFQSICPAVCVMNLLPVAALALPVRASPAGWS